LTWTCDACGLRCYDSEQRCPACEATAREQAWDFIERVANLDPNLGLMDIHALTGEAKRLLDEVRF
jgi:hypothetical protein